MARIIHVNCPACGGTLGMHGMDRLVRCRYCRTWSLVEGADFVPKYYVKPGLSKTDARRVVQRFLRDPDFPPGLLRSSRFHSARLYFIPYFEISARRLGTMILTQEKRQRQYRVGPNISEGGFAGASFSRELEWGPPVIETDTRVVMGDIYRIEPALELAEWGLESAEIDALRSRPEGMLHPFRRPDLERLGKIYDPVKTPDQALAGLRRRSDTRLLKDLTEMTDVKAKLVYYPVWRVKYQHQGRFYGVALDGVSGKLMAGRAPKNDRGRIFWMLAASALVAFISGKLSRSVGVAFLQDAEHLQAAAILFVNLFYILIPVLFVALVLALAVIGYGWDQFRYPGEVVIKGGDKRVLRLGRPERTGIDKVREFLEKIAESVRDGMERNFRRRA